VGYYLSQHLIGPELLERVDDIRLPRCRHLVDKWIQESTFGRCAVTHHDEVQILRGNAVGVKLLFGHSHDDVALGVAEDVQRTIGADVALTAVVFRLDSLHQLGLTLVDRIVQGAARYDFRHIECGNVAVVGGDLEPEGWRYRFAAASAYAALSTGMMTSASSTNL
jgi:hypothetical protein